MAKILITGGSGFIGTNLVDYYVQNNHEVLNLDINQPRNNNHLKFWVKSDICDFNSLNTYISNFQPDYVFHFAATTDLNGVTLDYYSANILGVESLIKSLFNCTSLKHVIFASSMLVCSLGYVPLNDSDYCPTNTYGQSKMIGEKIIKTLIENKFSWTIVRPTSFWGPWFSTPYFNFFDAIAKNKYFHPKGLRIYRSYGYVINMVLILNKLIHLNNSNLINEKTFYLADFEPIELFNWSYIISNKFNVSPPVEVPFFLLKYLAKFGDLLKYLGFKSPPLTTLRLNNLCTNAVYDLSILKTIVGFIELDLDYAVKSTVDWIKTN